MNDSKIDHMCEKYKSTVKDCKILYKDTSTPWSVGKGWYTILSEFSYLCEELNMRFYKKYRCRIVLEDVKQKWGSLRIYATVICDPCRFVTWITDILYSFSSKLKTINYHLKKISDVNSYNNYEIKIYNSIDEMENNNIVSSNIIHIKDKIVKFSKCFVYNRIKYKPTKFKFLYYIMCSINILSNFIFKFSLPFQKLFNSSENNVIVEYMNIKLDELVSKYEHESETTCEECGYKINTNHEPVCYTTGWVTTLCEICAKKSGSNYEMNGKIYNNGVIVKEIQNGKNNI